MFVFYCFLFLFFVCFLVFGGLFAYFFWCLGSFCAFIWFGLSSFFFVCLLFLIGEVGLVSVLLRLQADDVRRDRGQAKESFWSGGFLGWKILGLLIRCFFFFAFLKGFLRYFLKGFFLATPSWMMLAANHPTAQNHQALRRSDLGMRKPPY